MNTILDLFSSVFGFVYEFFFGCRHNRQTRPFTIEAETYKVCLDCGRQIFYSTERMTPLSMREVRRMKAIQHQPGVVLMPATAAERKLIAERGHKNTAAA
jgi:hypothetical protein